MEKIKISVIGLGLIGGSISKALKKHTNNEVFGFDINYTVLEKAQGEGVIDGIATKTVISESDLVIICLYAEDILPFVKAHSALFKKGALIMDFCGIKEYICAEAFKIARENGFVFIGGHPMAGREIYGYTASDADLFKGASMILCPDEIGPQTEIETLKALFLKIGFGCVVTTSPKEHDKIIAFTSQLAHIVSSSYIKSETSRYNFGFSAGSYKDLTRVARMNEKMWAGLFMLNKHNLIREIDTIIEHLNEYKAALMDDDKETLEKLIIDGTKLKNEDIL